VNPSPFTLEELAYILRLVTQADTSISPERWQSVNPLWGHGDVVALIVQDYFGGDLLGAQLYQLPEFASIGKHYWNRLPDGQEVDLTERQFGRNVLADLKPLAERWYRNLECGLAKNGIEFSAFENQFG